MLELLKIGALCVLVRPCRAFLQGFPPCTRLPLPGRFSQGSRPATRLPLPGHFSQGTRPATRRPLLKKGSIRKLFCGWATYFLWKGEESGMPDPLIFGNRSMDTVRRPLCGVLCFRAWWEASSESPWAFGDASHLHDLKRLGLFRRDEVPARNTPDCPASPLRPEKSF